MTELWSRVFTRPDGRPTAHMEETSQEVVHDLTNIRARLEMIGRLVRKMNLDERSRKSESGK